MSFESFLIRILNSDGGAVVGGGCLVSNRCIITCAHVVAEALEISADTPYPPKNLLYIDFPLLEKQPSGQAEVSVWFPLAHNPVIGFLEDLALLQLITPLPQLANPAHLQADVSNQILHLCGFPKPEGVYLQGTLQGLTAKGNVEIQTALGYGNVQGGFSGCPVLSQNNAVLGLVQEIANYDGNVRAYMIPASSLIHAFGQQVLSNPYKGLATFRQEDKNLFFGREREITALTMLVERQNFVSLVGTSGSGKSSVVFAGLVPRLNEQWQILDCRPKNKPFHELALSLVRLLYSDKLEQAIQLDKLEKRLITGEVALKALLHVWQRNLDTPSRLLIIIDQFEELYTLNDKATQLAFLDCLLNLIHSDAPFTLLITLRADFINHALEYPNFAATLNDHTRFISTMNRDELREVIEFPAQQVGLSLQSGLSEQIIDDVGINPGQLPLLQFALYTLFEYPHHGLLALEAYEKIGGVEKALAKYADTIYEQFTKEEDTQRLRAIFVQLVRPGEGTEHTRQVATCEQVGGNSCWQTLIAQLADKRLVITGRDEKTNEETVELVHEALIRHWQPLQDWMETDKAFRLWQNGLRRDMQDNALLQSTRLNVAQNWLQQRQAELTEAERAFIDASIQAKQRQLRTKKLAVSALVFLLILSLMAGIFSLWQWRQAENRRMLALRSQTLFLINSAKIELEKNEPVTAILLALEALPKSIAKPDRPYMPEAERMLYEAVSEFKKSELRNGHDNGINFVKYSPDSKKVATFSSEKICVWDALNDKPPICTKNIGNNLLDASFSGDGNKLAIFTLAGIDYFWEIDTNKSLLGVNWGKIPGARDKSIDDIVKTAYYGDDSDKLKIISTNGQKIAFIEKKSAQESKLFIWHKKNIWLPNKASDDADSFIEPKIIKLDSIPIKIKFAPNNEKLVVIFEQRVLILNTNHLEDSVTINTKLSDGFISSDSKKLVSVSGTIAKLWDLNTGKFFFSLEGHTGNVDNVAFSTDGQQIATASGEDNTIRIWDVSLMKLQHVLTVQQTRPINHIGINNETISLSYSKDSQKLLAVFSNDVGARIWETKTGNNTAILPKTGGNMEASYNPDNTKIITYNSEFASIWHNSNNIQELIDYANSVLPRHLSKEERNGLFLEE